ncbi:hypothetical protein [Tsukamurella strandjordii]|uniref:Lipoprotein LpqN n=1 Tax=Tsukamurella strandjordii TaxID=147577 RepID=A0AA90NGN1_9ACTN|nr:hypothetical protein [Tsukamurella strandjordii]MDP0398129.1 hypothetical protein [Tsukamurella strandjordii]
MRRIVGFLLATALLATSCGTQKPAINGGPERSTCDATKPTGEAVILEAPITVKIPKLPRWWTAERTMPDSLSVITRQPERLLSASLTIRVGQATRQDDAEGSLQFLAGLRMPSWKETSREAIRVCGLRGIESVGVYEEPRTVHSRDSDKRPYSRQLTKAFLLVGDRVGTTLYMIQASVRISDETTEFDTDIALMLDNLEIVRS